jgi:hypothetical protein
MIFPWVMPCSWSFAWLLVSCRHRLTGGSKQVVATVTRLLQPLVVGSLRQVARRHVCHLHQTQSLNGEEKKTSLLSKCTPVYDFIWQNTQRMTGLPFAWSHPIGDIESAKRPTRGLGLEWHLQKKLPKITTRPEWQGILILPHPLSWNPCITCRGDCVGLACLAW